MARKDDGYDWMDIDQALDSPFGYLNKAGRKAKRKRLIKQGR